MRRYLSNRHLLFWLIDYYMGPYSPRYKRAFPHSPRVQIGISTL